MRGKWKWWAATAVVMIGVSLSAGAVKPSWSLSSDGTERVELQAALGESLTGHVVRALEADPAWIALAGGPDGTTATCGADVFGIEPATAATVADITSVYAWVDCLWSAPSGRPGHTAAEQVPPFGISEAVVVHLDPTRWELPSEGAAHAPSVRRMFPRELWDAALRGGLSATLATRRLDERLRGTVY
jgi:hypothetical protein